MTYVINTNESIDKLALALYDEKNETLREVTSDDLLFPVFSGKRIIKRLYLIGEYIYNNPLRVTVSCSDPNQYIAKVLIGRDNPRFSDFIEYTNTDRATYAFSHSYLNALPVDIYVESLGISYEDVSISIEIQVEERVDAE